MSLETLDSFFTINIDDLVLCPICLEQKPERSTINWPNCKHTCCKRCFYKYLETSINDGIVHIKCYMSDCKEYLPDKIIRNYMPDDLLVKYDRYRFIQSNQNARECPFCNTYQEGDPKHPDTVCVNCNKHFCFFHTNAHPFYISCEEYERELENKNNIIPDEDLLKPCPHCKILTEKISGCNHMKCSYCHVAWCWICGREITDSELSIHYRWWNFMGCPNRMMDNNNEEFHGIKNFLYRTSYFLVFMILGIPVLFLFLLTAIVCFPCAFYFMYVTSSNGRIEFNRYLVNCEECCNVMVLFCVTLPCWMCYGIYRLIQYCKGN